ncbi:hypothetical protein [Candidatus Lokiarchaeum ossiferum]
MINDTSNYPVTATYESKDQRKEYSQIFDYICKLCPQRSQKSIYYNQLKSRLRKRFKLNESSVKQVINHFVSLNALIVAFDDSISINILSNSTRKDIYDLIQRYPGVYSNVFKKSLGLGSRQVLWHIAFLLEFNIIKFESFGKIKAYGIITVEPKAILLGFIVLKDSLRTLLIHLMSDPAGFELIELVHIISKPKNSVLYTLKKLKELNVLSISLGETKHYCIRHELLPKIDQTISRYNNIFQK